MAFKPQISSSYVKFVRGTTTAWANIAEKNDDTLYFIYDQGATTGKLYLGDKLISDSSSSTFSLGDITDINLSEAGIFDKSLLVYNGNTGKWEDQPLGTVLSATVDSMVGATATTNGTAGIVPMPKKGEQNLFLRGDATWANPVADVEDDLSDLIDLLYRDETDKTLSIRDIAAAEVGKIVASAPEEFDTLKEIADWLAEHNTVLDLATAEKQLNTLNDAVFGKEASNDEDGNEISPAVEGLVDAVANLKAVVKGEFGLESRVTSLENEVGPMSSKVTVLEENYTTINEQLTTIEKMLYWSDLVAE